MLLLRALWGVADLAPNIAKTWIATLRASSTGQIETQKYLLANSKWLGAIEPADIPGLVEDAPRPAQDHVLEAAPPCAAPIRKVRQRSHLQGAMCHETLQGKRFSFLSQQCVKDEAGAPSLSAPKETDAPSFSGCVSTLDPHLALEKGREPPLVEAWQTETIQNRH